MGRDDGIPVGAPDGRPVGISVQHSANEFAATLVPPPPNIGKDQKPVHWKKANEPTLFTVLGMYKSPRKPVH